MTRGKGITKVAARRSKVAELARDGKTIAEIGEATGASRVTIWRDLSAMTSEFRAKATTALKDWKEQQVKVYELMEQALLTEQISPEIAREWRAIRTSIGNVLGVDAPQKQVVATANFPTYSFVDELVAELPPMDIVEILPPHAKRSTMVMVEVPQLTEGEEKDES